MAIKRLRISNYNCLKPLMRTRFLGMCTVVKKSKKIAITSRKFLKDEDKSETILEYKYASDVMRKLNLENKYLFGNIISQPKKIEIATADTIIQHLPEITVCENIQRNRSQIAKDSLLEFPLINKLDTDSQSDTVIKELNELRVQLMQLCGDKPFPSVTTILQKTMPVERVAILERWKQKMIRELGAEGFEKYQKELFSTGSSLHRSINNLLSAPEEKVEVEQVNSGHWKSLECVFPHISEVKLLEEHVKHPFLLYRGVIDCFAKYKNNLFVIDWKTSKKHKSTISKTYDSPLQIAAYAGALNFDPKFQYMVKTGLLVIAYESGQPATIHIIKESSLLVYWQYWLKRIKLYWELENSSTP